jgi:hypothetical protein
MSAEDYMIEMYGVGHEVYPADPESLYDDSEEADE